MAERVFDAVVIGAGSVGLPTALFLAEAGLKTAVIDRCPSPGQGENKAAIGGVRATHSDPAKILLCSESLRIFSTWEETYGTPIGWKKGGYLYPVYREEDRKTLQRLLPVQHAYNLGIEWIGPDEIALRVPGISRESLLGGTWAAGDGQVSPLLANVAMYQAARKAGCRFFFNERVTDIDVCSGTVRGVESGMGRTETAVLVNAAGAEARELSALAGVDIPVVPEIHEAGITSPMEQFLGPLVVDMRPGKEGETANFYFGQNAEGAVIFCYTPLLPGIGLGRESTSGFLPVLARRLIDLLPRMKNALVRRTWAGHYPMTPDGLPIVGEAPGVGGFYLAAGMCGQGFMLGPGVGKNIADLITRGRASIDGKAFETLRPDRRFHAEVAEVLT